MKRYWISIGSNIQPDVHIPKSLRKIRSLFCIKKMSSIYETTPFGPAGKIPFWNLVVQIVSTKEPSAIRSNLKQIEKELGRNRNQNNKYMARTIDLDLLPQPGYQTQPFVMIPLAEAAPLQRDPDTRKTFGLIAKQFAAEKKSYRKVLQQRGVFGVGSGTARQIHTSAD